MTYYYPYSRTYLATKMSRASRVAVVVGLAVIVWVILFQAGAAFFSLFN